MCKTVINVIKKIFSPNKIFGFVTFNLGFGLLIYVFTNHIENTPITYISYILSFYALLIFLVWLYKVYKFSNESIKKSNIYHIYQKNPLIVTKISMYASFICNLIYGIFKFIIGIYYMSWWFITFAVYYLLLCIMKISIAKNIKNEKSNLKDEYKKLKSTGIILLFLNLILVGIIILIISQDQIISYNGYIIYAVALYDFGLIISAIVNVIKFRKDHSPILVASKCINLTVAMISMISLEVAMITQFGDNSHLKVIMTGTMGVVICIINTVMAVFMVVKANNKLIKILGGI